MTRRLVFTARATRQLRAIRRYIAKQAGNDVAHAFVDRIIAQCERIADAPAIGSPRPSFGPGLRSFSHRRRVLIVYTFDDETVHIALVLYKGQDPSRFFGS